MSSSYFGRPIRFFGNRAVLILCIIFFLVPFALRGARMSLARLENNIKDWLPSDFPETKDLDWFGEHFIGERFVLVTWPGCTAADQRFQLLVKKLRNEVIRTDEQLARSSPEIQQEERVRRTGDKLGLFTDGEYFQNWGGLDEKWLRGEGDLWYFITPEGQLYRWSGESTPGGWLQRRFQGGDVAEGDLIATVGEGSPNPFYQDPRRLTARYFNSVTTGPELLDELAVEGGAFWPRGDIAEELKTSQARRTGHEKLTGTLFGPAVGSDFTWTASDFADRLTDQKRAELPEGWEETFDNFVTRLIDQDYGGNRDALLQSTGATSSRHWDDLFNRLGVEPPPRQTCVVVTLSEPGKRDLRRVLGRGVLGTPPGKLVDLAVNESNISLIDLKMGGPPVDNVAIDEEGSITLVRLVGWSAAVGIILSLICFRSGKVTLMVFFVGGISAITSLAIVWWSGWVPAMAGLSTVDSILLSMPSLVYVLGLSGAVHIVNYYREATRHGLDGAPDRALSHGWGPCSLAAFTTALGLVSLSTSNLLPIRKFGIFSALGVMATLMLLFFYLPSALQIFPPGYHKQKHDGNAGSNPMRFVERFWVGVGEFVIRRHWVVAGACIAAMVAVGWGIPNLRPSVQLLKLFDPSAKVIKDYGWMEDHFGKLVPMELVARVMPEMQRPPLSKFREMTPEERHETLFQLSVLERVELTSRIHEVVEREFGESSRDVIGRAMSVSTFITGTESYRAAVGGELEDRYHELPSDYLRIDHSPEHEGAELWRISERLGALNDVDYGLFVHEQKLAVEPVLTAYRIYHDLLRGLDQQRGGRGVARSNVVFLGSPDPTKPADAASVAVSDAEPAIDQTRIFAETLDELLKRANCRTQWVDPATMPVSQLAGDQESWGKLLGRPSSIVLVNDHADYDPAFIGQHARMFVDARDHQFELGVSKTATERGDPVQVVYTGVVPVVYKAQRTLLNSLVDSIGLAFVMIAIVMMILLRDWGRGPGLFNWVNGTAGVVSMVPNVFPVVVIFGAMGHRGLLVDIGTMMTASVAMGIAVDDTIHFLTWFRTSIRQGMTRDRAIIEAYRRVGTAMTQTTLIGGLGLAVFALSTFTPTQQFGVMMVALLAAALVGDLVLLPALLASPIGIVFCPRSTRRPDDTPQPDVADTTTDESSSRTPHSGPQTTAQAKLVRADRRHNLPRH